MLTVAADGTVVPKPVEVGALYGGLRVVRRGLAPTDRVIVDGLMHAMPGTKVKRFRARFTSPPATVPSDPSRVRPDRSGRPDMSELSAAERPHPCD